MRSMLLVLALAGATPTAARDLGVPADKGWRHAETGLVLMPRLAGLPRTALTDATQTERDVTAQFEAADKGVFATIYIFHPAIADVGLWFDRSRTVLEARDVFRHAAPATADPVGFAAGGAPAASSLRQVYAVPGGPFRSTALAVVPVGDWIVGVRMSARTLTADQLDARLSQLIGDVRWPDPAATTAAAARPVAACATPLAFAKARRAKPNGGDMLMSLLGASIAAKAEAEAPAAPAPRRTWCREGEARVEYGVYRPDGDAGGYVLALYDAGRVASVHPSLMGQIDKSGTYAVTLEDVDGAVSTFPSFTSLPAPKQVWDLIGSGERTGVAKGDKVTINARAS